MILILFNRIAIMFKHRKIAVLISDTIFSIITFISAALFLLIEGKGRLEGYILFGAFVGAVLFLLIFPHFGSVFSNKKTKSWIFHYIFVDTKKVIIYN